MNVRIKLCNGGVSVTAKEELIQIRQIDKALRSTELEIARCRADIYSVHAVDYSAERVSGGSHQDIADKIAILSELLDKANREWDQLINLRTEIRQKIANIDSYVLRAVLIEYYVLQKNWEQVADDMGYSIQHVYRIHGKALQAYQSKNYKDERE